MEKISFSVEDAKLINENPDSSFAVMSLDFFASGKNMHDLYVSEETLLRTADSIKNCPLVWKYDEILDDIYTHDKDEVPCGFVPESSTIEAKRLPDGRTMLSVIAYVWKRYTGELLEFFKRDGGKKPLSVEMSVFDTRPMTNGLRELLDYRFEGITLLGSFVTPAIPLANATVLSFAQIEKEYKEAVKKEFSFVNADMEIPESIKENAKKGLELRKQYGRGGTSVSLAFAKFIVNNAEITPEKARRVVEYFSKHKSNIINQADPPSEDYISSLLWGGSTAWKWAKSIVDKIERDEKDAEFAELATFPYKNKEEMEMTNMPKTKEELELMSAEEKVAYEAEMAKEAEKPEEAKMAEEAEKPEEVEMAEKPEEAEMAEKPEEGEKEEPSKEKKFEFPKNMSLEKMDAMFASDDEEDVKMAKEELKKEFANPSVVMAGMFAKMCKMAEAVEKMAEKEKVYMAENEELKRFKADLEVTQKSFAVEQTLKELGEKVVLSAEAKEEMLAEAEKYSFETIDEWKTFCKAKALDFAIRDSSKSDVVRVGGIWTATAHSKKDELWS